MAENIIDMSVNKIIVNKENSDIETRNNSLNYFNFDKNITKLF